MGIKVWLSLGSNIGDRLEYLRSARQQLDHLSIDKLKHSSIYESAPWGGIAKGAFLNQVVSLQLSLERLNTILTPQKLKDMLSNYKLDPLIWSDRLQFINSSLSPIKEIESLMLYLLVLELEHGRNRKADAVRWDSRTLDLDILAIQSMRPSNNPMDLDIFHQYKSPYLELPHPRLEKRLFILKPWYEIAPQLYIPSLKTTLRDLINDCPNDDSLYIYACSS